MEIVSTQTLGMKWNNRLFKRAISRRDSSWDYNSTGSYFVTINVKVQLTLLALISEDGYCLTGLGLLVEDTMLELSNQFSNVTLGPYVIMPDHIHLMIEVISVQSVLPENVNGGFAGKDNPMFHQGLGRAIRWLKGRSTFEIRKLEPEFSWQKNYYERRITSDAQEEIANYYIQQNPIRWLKKHKW